jgi:transposase
MKRAVRRCCGIDVHQTSLSVCVRLRTKGKLRAEIRTFGTVSEELLALHDWLQGLELTHIAMEATGVCWKPVYYILEDAFSVMLVNPAAVKRMPGPRPMSAAARGWRNC